MRKKTYKNLTALEIGEEIKKELGIDIYQNTRQAAYVKARALMCHLLREKLNLRWTSIAEIFQSEGKNMNHTNVLHLVKMYSIYRREDHNLMDLEKRFVFTQKVGRDFDYSKYLEDKYESLEEKYYRLEKKYLDIIEK
jgi:chromosomal replication initiation ATPase DnaA